MTLPRPKQASVDQVHVLKSVAEQPIPMAEEAQTAVDLKLFKGVPLTDNLSYNREINQQRFFHALADSTERRTGCLPGKQRSKDEYQSFLNNIKVLQPSNWPDWRANVGFVMRKRKYRNSAPFSSLTMPGKFREGWGNTLTWSDWKLLMKWDYWHQMSWNPSFKQWIHWSSPQLSLSVGLTWWTFWAHVEAP